jgi:NitT/TauT family transport system substrate-binding protein
MTWRPRTAGVVALCALSAVLAACGSDSEEAASGGAATGTTDVNLLLNYSPGPQEHAYFVTGIRKGFFEEEGINLTLTPGTGTGDAIKAAAVGRFKLALADTSTTMTAIDEGTPVITVGVLTQTSPMSVIFRKSTNIKTVKDLAGKTIASSGGGSLTETFPGLLKANGMAEDSVKLVPTAGTLTEQAAMLTGQTDAFLGTFPSDGVPLNLKGEDVSWLRFADFGVNPLGQGVIANKPWLAENKELMAAFLRATQKSIEYTIDNIDEAAQLFIDEYPDVYTVETATASLKEQVKLLHRPGTEDLPPLATTDEVWEDQQELMVKYLDLDPSIPLSEFHTDEFLR